MYLSFKYFLLFKLFLTVHCFLPISVHVQSIINILPKSNINSQCKNDLYTFLSAVTNSSLWALQMYDATGKQPSGILEGNIYSLGQYDQCLLVKSPDKNIQGQYCFVNFQMKVKQSPWKEYYNHLTLDRLGLEDPTYRKGPMVYYSTTFHQWGVCVPSSCSHLDVQNLLQKWADKLQSNTEITMMVPKDACSIEKPFQLSTMELIILSPLAIIIIMVVFSSIMDLNQKASTSTSLPSKWQQIIQSFSIEKNFSEIFKQQGNSIESLDGIRSLSIFWVILTHRVIIYYSLPSINRVEMAEKSRSIYNSWWFNTSLCTDTFLLLGGFLRGIGITKQYEKNERSFWTDLKQRYLRLTPSYAITLIIHTSLMPYIGNGPIWDMVWQEEKRRCDKSWLFNLLYLNNFISYDNFCLIQSWYIGADMHLFLLAPLIIYPLYKWSQTRKAILSIGLLSLGILLPFSLTYILELPGMIFFNVHDFKIYGFVRWIYMNPICRIFPYSLGLIFGYWFHYNKKTQIQLSKKSIISGWITSMVCLSLAVMSGSRFMQKDYQFDILESSLFSALHRASWTTGIVWVIFACHFGYGGAINKVLSSKVWMPISKISFCMFLTHMFVLLYHSFRIRSSQTIDEIILFHNYFGELTFIIPLGLVFYLLVEAPFAKITKILTVEDKIVSNGTIRESPAEKEVNVINRFINELSSQRNDLNYEKNK